MDTKGGEQETKAAQVKLWQRDPRKEEENSPSHEGAFTTDSGSRARMCQAASHPPNGQRETTSAEATGGEGSPRLHHLPLPPLPSPARPAWALISEGFFFMSLYGRVNVNAFQHKLVFLLFLPDLGISLLHPRLGAVL